MPTYTALMHMHRTVKIARCFLKLVQSGKTIQYVFIHGYSRNYITLCDRKNLADGRGGPLTTGGPIIVVSGMQRTIA